MARRSDESEGFQKKAFRRASRLAFAWPVEAGEVHGAGDSLTILSGIGPFLDRVVREWLDEPPEPPDPDPLRMGFLTRTRALDLIAREPFYASSIRSDLQMHSEMSDGAASLRDLKEAAGSRGHDFIAITDHSRTLKIAGGVDEDEFLVQANQIDELNQEGGVRLLKSIEMNLLPDGSGDMEPNFLRRMDLVLGSFHSKLRLKEDQTDRYVAAIQNPSVDVLAHPRGRIYNFRSGLSARWEEVIAAAVDNDKALEVDCFPDRQDLDVGLLRLAAEAGCLISIGTDAHYPDQLDFLDLGRGAVIDAGVPMENVINTWPLEKITAWAASHR